jgi:Type II CAAX prenyl endopeptidase Rce1-like
LIILSAVVFPVVALLFYGPAKWVVGVLARRCLRPVGHHVDMPASDLEQVIRLTLAVVAQAGLLAGLVSLLHVDLRWADRADVLLVPLAVMLGFAEMLASRFACELIIRADMALSSGRRDLADWRALARAGWLRSYSAAFRRLPVPLAASLLIGYVVVEEAIFRGVATAEYGRFGQVVAVVASSAMFTAVQVFRMPSWRSAVFPVVGGAFVGVVHALLYVRGASLLPLIVAHVVFFVLSTSSIPGTAQARPTALARRL